MDDPSQQGPNGPEPGFGAGGTGTPGPAFEDLRRALHDALGPAQPGLGPERQCVDLCPICRTADVLRATVPPEVQDHWYAWQREILLAVRAMLDHYIERVETERRRSVEVEDIPID